MNIETKQKFLEVLRDVRAKTGALLATLRAGKRGDIIENEDELKTVLDELRDVEGRVLRNEPIPEVGGQRRLVSARIALDWNFSALASPVMDLSALYRAL
jgi:hypothetical protein